MTMNVKGPSASSDANQASTRRARARSTPAPPVEREDGVGQDRDLEALLGLNPGAPEGLAVELSG
jgi:hypothetical protein